MYYIVTDEFGFAWGDLVETLEEAQRQLQDIKKDARENLDWDYDGFIIEIRKG